jgi:UrcA family protein
MKSIQLLVSVVALSLSGLASASSQSETPSEVPSIVVKYDELSLTSPAGVKRLHARLRTAARTVCAQLDSRILGLREQYDHCVRDAVARSVADVGNASLTSYHRIRRIRAPVLAAN